MTDRRPLDQCDACGYDAERWDDRDTVKTIELLGVLAGHWTEVVPDAARNERPSPEVWSINEYIDHMRETTFGMRFLAELAAGDAPPPDLEPVIPGVAGPHRLLDADSVLEGLADEATALARLVRSLGDKMDAAISIGGSEHSVRWASRHAVHDGWHHLRDIAAITSTLGFAVERQDASVVQVNASNGGVPKTATSDLSIDLGGALGDVQAARAHHGRPWQALCLWSADVIEALRSEGHPIEAGSAGENVTLSGIDWAALHGGAVLTIGDVVCQLSAPAVPCSKNNRWFADRDSSRIDHDLHPGWSRWYASVLTPGTIQPGDPAVLGAEAQAPI